MSEMKLNLCPGFMRKLVTKVISKLVCEKLGYKVNVELNQLGVTNTNGKVCLHLDVNADMDNAEFEKMIRDIGLG